MRKELCLALAKHAGSVLTPETAKAIVADLFPDRSIDPAQFKPELVGRYCLQAERFGATEEMRRLHAAFHAEIDRTGDPLDFDYERLADLAHAGALVQFTARQADSGELAGVMRLFVGTSVRTKRLSVRDEMFYVGAGHRGHVLATRLWRFAERSMFSIGAREVSITAHGRVARMARFMGYPEVATKFSKTHHGDDYAEVSTRHQEKHK